VIVSLLIAAVISLFAVGAGIILLWRFRDWRFGFLAGLALFAAAWVFAYQVIQLSSEAGGLADLFRDFDRAFPTLVLSIMAVSVMFFLERIIRRRSETKQNLELAQISMERAKIPVFWFAPEGEIRYVNGAAQEFLGYSRDELLAMTVHDIAPTYAPGEWQRDWSALKEGGSRTTELYYSTKTEQLVPVEMTAIDVGSTDRDLGCMFVRDITERKATEVDLQLAKGKAESASQAKSAFLASMSHELRTPLNAIIGFAEVIKDEMCGPRDPVKYHRYAEDIYSSGQHLLALINDILDLSKVESGAAELHDESIDVRDLVQCALSLVKHGARTAEVDLVMEIGEDLPLLWADERKLKQVLVNLLANSVKFTEPGGVITFKAWCRADSGFVFQVVDTGIGMAGRRHSQGPVEIRPDRQCPQPQIRRHRLRPFPQQGLDRTSRRFPRSAERARKGHNRYGAATEPPHGRTRPRTTVAANRVNPFPSDGTFAWPGSSERALNRQIRFADAVQDLLEGVLLQIGVGKAPKRRPVHSLRSRRADRDVLAQSPELQRGGTGRVSMPRLGAGGGER
jgi:PAS domain S-box-containing protein